MIDDLVQPVDLHPANHFVRAKGPFAGSAPDVDPFGVQDQQPEVVAVHVAAHDIERHLVIGRDQNLAIGSW